MLVYKHSDCLLKDNGFNHPERKERIDSILESIEQRKRYINDLNKPFELNDRPISSTSYAPNKSASNIIHYDKDDNSDNYNFKFVY